MQDICLYISMIWLNLETGYSDINCRTGVFTVQFKQSNWKSFQSIDHITEETASSMEWAAIRHPLNSITSPIKKMPKIKKLFSNISSTFSLHLEYNIWLCFYTMHLRISITEISTIKVYMLCYVNTGGTNFTL